MMPGLKVLILNGNGIEFLDECVFENLVYLDIRDNRISDLSFIRNMPKL